MVDASIREKLIPSTSTKKDCFDDLLSSGETTLALVSISFVTKWIEKTFQLKPNTFWLKLEQSLQVRHDIYVPA